MEAVKAEENEEWKDKDKIPDKAQKGKNKYALWRE
jgi:hypothetical protein